MFDGKIYTQRRDKLRDDLESGLLLFLGNEESPMNYLDNPFHFRQDSTFLYFFGLNYAGLAAVIDADTGTETVFGNDLTVDDIIWMGIQPTLTQKSSRVGVKQNATSQELEEVLKKALKSGRKIHYLPPSVMLYLIMLSFRISISEFVRYWRLFSARFVISWSISTDSVEPFR